MPFLYSNDAYVEMILILGECGRNAVQAAEVYADRFPNVPHPCSKTFERLVQRVKDTGSVKPMPRVVVNLQATNELNQTLVLNLISNEPHISTRQVCNQTNISQSTVCRILKKSKKRCAHFQVKMVTGKEFRGTLHKPTPNAKRTEKDTLHAPHKSVPPHLKTRKAKPGPFKLAYFRHEIPLVINSNRKTCTWTQNLEEIDYSVHLPLFFDGLSETDDTLKQIVTLGLNDLLIQGGHRIFCVIPQLIIPIKKALHTKNKAVMINTLRVLQLMVKSYPRTGEALVPYYRQILPILNIYKEKNVNCGDGIDYSQINGENLADAINDTLCILEEYGGEDAFINIKYLIPTYESCVQN